ncbi:hypothetical protein AX17_006755 [Amanita inopinata Kibby_2008]|nr:hypothetical protein AX17_006755 [Amanita inopinata Kibby_2008]
MSPKEHSTRLDSAQLIAVFVESSLIGVFFVLWIQCLQALYERSRQRKERFFQSMSVTAIAMFFLIVALWITDLTIAFAAFIIPREPEFCITPMGMNPAEMVYLDLADPKFVLHSALYVSITLLGDGFMVY